MAITAPESAYNCVEPPLHKARSQNKYLNCVSGYTRSTTEASQESYWKSASPSLPHADYDESTDPSNASATTSNLSTIAGSDDTALIEEARGYCTILPPGGHISHSGRTYCSNRNETNVMAYAMAHGLNIPTVDGFMDPNNSRDVSEPDALSLFTKHTEDDTAVSLKPSGQVDYLSHTWVEEEVWWSWRYIVSNRGKFADGTRLENASWRAWMKAKNNLQTTSPVSINWLKDCDVTWLYGPLLATAGEIHGVLTLLAGPSLSKTESSVNTTAKRPILKQRTVFGILLQRSLPSTSVLKQPNALNHMQSETGETPLGYDSTLSALSSSRPSIKSTSTAASTNSSSLSCGPAQRKRIHFKEEVEQCIAIDIRDNTDDDNDDCCDSVDTLTVQILASKRQGLRHKTSEKCVDGRIIGSLPPAKLKYPEDTTDHNTARRHNRCPMTVQSQPQDAIRRVRQQHVVYFDKEDDEDDEMYRKTGSSQDYSNLFPDEGGLHRSSVTGSLQAAISGLRSAPSGKLMACDADDAPEADGFCELFKDTADTVRNIFYVIWNIGWPR